MATQERRIPDATVARLPEYLRILVELADRMQHTVSSGQLAEFAGVNAAKVRKDLSFLGSYGTRGVGYDVGHLLFEMRRALGLSDETPVVVVGAGNLGRALVNYVGFGERGFPVLAIVDNDPAKIGQSIGRLTVRPEEELNHLVAATGAKIGVIAVPPSSAQARRRAARRVRVSRRSSTSRRRWSVCPRRFPSAGWIWPLSCRFSASTRPASRPLPPAAEVPA